MFNSSSLVHILRAHGAISGRLAAVGAEYFPLYIHFPRMDYAIHTGFRVIFYPSKQSRRFWSRKVGRCRICGRPCAEKRLTVNTLAVSRERRGAELTTAQSINYNNITQRVDCHLITQYNLIYRDDYIFEMHYSSIRRLEKILTILHYRLYIISTECFFYKMSLFYIQLEHFNCTPFSSTAPP